MAGLRFPAPMKKGAHRQRTPLCLELLESRCLPSTVTNLSDHDPGSLRDAIATTPPGGTVDFQSDLSGTITLTSDTLTIVNDLTVAGPGSNVITVSGIRAFQMFTIAPTITVKTSGLTIANGMAPLFGGGISNDGTLALSDSVISSNRSGNRGGGIYNGPSGTLLVSNSTFSGNLTPNAGGGIYNVGTLTLNSTTFSGNGSMTADGGAVFNVGMLTVNNCTFSGNGGSNAFGGAIRNDGEMIADGGTFSGNTAYTGAAVFNVGTATVRNAMISKNSLKFGDQGGGMFNEGTLTVSNCTISGNNGGSGGGIYNSASLVISNSILSGNGASPGSGGGVFNLGTATINGSTVSGNGGRAGGGGIFSRGTLTVDHSTISDNGAGTQGGGIYSGGTLIVSDCTIAHNSGYDGAGGGITNESGTLTINNTTMSSNYALYVGSAIWMEGGKLNLSNSIVSGGRIGESSGAAIFAPSATISNCTISDNQRGDAVFGSGTISNSVISRNNGGSNAGGGIEGQWTISYCTISDNQGGLEAGGFYGSGSISNSTISGNKGITAGGIVANGPLTISSSTISANICSSPFLCAGALHVKAGQATVTLIHCTVSANTVQSLDQRSAQLVVQRSTLKLRNTIISGGGSKPNFFANGGTFVSLGHNLTSDGGSGFLTGPGDLINLDPLLGLLQDNGGPTKTMALRLGSPAIDAGDNTDAPAFDQRGPGFPRIVGGIIDSGAFEVQPGLATHLQITAPAQVTSNTPFDVTVTALDAYGHTAAGYLGMVTFSSSDPDPGVVLPADYTFTDQDSSMHTFLAGVTLITPGNQTLNVTDTSGITGSTSVTVVPGPLPPPAGAAGSAGIRHPSASAESVAVVDQLFASRSAARAWFVLTRRQHDVPADDLLR